MKNTLFFRILAVTILTSGLCQILLVGKGVAASVVFKIWNDTSVPITGIYDKDSRQDNWGINDLANPLTPRHYFYIRMDETSYAHCPNMQHDVRLVFANGAVKVLHRVEICKYDVHINRP